MLVIGCDCFMFVVDRNIVCCWKHFTHTVLVRYVSEFWQFQKCKEFCNLQQLAGLKLFYSSWQSLFDLVKFTSHSLLKTPTFLVLYSAAEPCISSSTSCFTTFLWNSTCYEAPQTPVSEYMLSSQKASHFHYWILWSSLSQFILLCSFCCSALPLLP